MNEGVETKAQEFILGQAIAKARRRAGLTQQELCMQAKLSYSTLAKIERGAIKTPSVFTIAAIAEATGTTIEALAGIETSLSPQGPPRSYKTSKTGIKFVYFDVNGVLVRFYQRAFTKIAQKHNVSIDAIENIYWHYNDAVCRGEMDLSEFDAILARRIGVDAIAWSDYYLTNIDPVKDAQDILRWTAENYRVGLISNTMPGLIDTMIKRDIIPDVGFQTIIDSSEIKTIKPEPMIFEQAAQKAGVDNQELLLIDDMPPNLMAAESLGWHVLWFDAYHPDESADRVKQALEF